MTEDDVTDEDRRLQERMRARLGVHEPKREELIASAEAEKKPRPAIGGRIGVGADFVRDPIAKQEGTPSKRSGERYYAFEDDLISFLRGG